MAKTKRYANSIMNTTIASGGNLSARTMKWRRLGFDVIMLKRFLGLVMNMGLVVKKDLVMSWDTKFPIPSTNFI